MVAARSSNFWKLVQALVIAQLMKGSGRLINLTVLAQVHTTVERDEDGQPCGIDSPLEDPARLRDILAEFLAGTATPIG